MSKYPKSVPSILILAAAALLVIISGLYLYSTKKGSPQDLTANWETYKHSELSYEFQYPASWRIPPSANGDTNFYIFYRIADPEAEYEGYFIYGGYVSESQLSTTGVSYCDANPDDSSRCENIKLGGQDATINWRLKENNLREIEADIQIRASVWILHPKGGIVTFELKPVIPETKTILYQILSTFKFLDGSFDY